MKKEYTLKLSKEQLMLIANCLEDISRFASGQWQLQRTVEEMVRGTMPFDKQIEMRDEAEEFLRQAKKVLLPDLPDNASKGYNGTEFIGNTYQIYRSIYHHFAVEENWNNVYSSPALPSGNLGIIEIQKIEQEKCVYCREYGNLPCDDCNENLVK